MTWIPLLLADASPNLRYLVLRELLGRPEGDSEVQELLELREKDSLTSSLLKLQNPDGSWKEKDILGNAPGGSVQVTAQVLTRLGYIGMNPQHPTVRKGIEYLFSKQKKDGSWPIPRLPKLEVSLDRGYTMMPLQNALPLIGIAAAGHATDPRAERGYDWLLENRLEDGAWPTGLAGEVRGYVGGYRRLPHSRWGCRSNTTAAVMSLALHPERRKNEPARRGLDHLLSRETKDPKNIGHNVARTVGYEAQSGWITYFARFDLALVLDLCWRIGATTNDDRVNEIVHYVKSIRGEFGMWDYASNPLAARWITFDLLRSLSKIDASTDWYSMEPSTPFKAYVGQPRRH